MSAPFWGDRYQARKMTYAGRPRWTVWDTKTDRDTFELPATLRAAKERAAELNGDPSANFNGWGWPRVYFRGNVWGPLDPCDCQDSSPHVDGPRNVCGGVMGTFCRAHGVHDDCPRSIRGVSLTCDPERIKHVRHRVIRLRRDIEAFERLIEKEEDRIDQAEREARIYCREQGAAS